MLLNNPNRTYGDYLFFIFRVLVAYLFFEHGTQKLFGWFGGINGASVPITSLFGAAGIIETVVGILIFFGLFTRLAALIGAIEMVIAYIKVHIPQNAIPLLNQGEPALLFFASFLVLLVYGARRFSLEKLLLKKEVF